MSVNVYQSDRNNIPEDLNDRQHSCENFTLNSSYRITPTNAPHRTHTQVVRTLPLHDAAFLWHHQGAQCVPMLEPANSDFNLHKCHCVEMNTNQSITILAPELFFLILAHPVYKMWIIQEQNTLELWNKLHSEEKKTESILKLNSVALVRTRTIPTERPPQVGEVSANFCG